MGSAKDYIRLIMVYKLQKNIKMYTFYTLITSTTSAADNTILNDTVKYIHKGGQILSLVVNICHLRFFSPTFCSTCWSAFSRDNVTIIYMWQMCDTLLDRYAYAVTSEPLHYMAPLFW